MKRVSRRSVSPEPGFTLVEVLLALTMAALGFGVILHSLGRQMTLVSGSLDRHQMLMFASEALESTMAGGGFETEVEPQDVPVGAFGGDDEGEGAEVAQYFYRVEAGPVTADPRVEQVLVTVKSGRGQTQLAAYRLKVRRE